MVVRPVKALCDESGGVQSAQECLAESRQQERPDRCQETSRAAAEWIAFGGLPRREWRTNIERTGAQLSDDQQGSHAHHESGEGAVSKLGYSLRRHASLCTAPSLGMVEQDHGSWRAPSGRVLSTNSWTGCRACAVKCGRIYWRESRKHNATELLRQVPCIGPIRAAQLIALMQTPHRFRTKRQLWTYSGLAVWKRTAVGNTATWKDSCNAPRNRRSFAD